MNAIAGYFRQLTLKPQGITVVIAAFLPIIAIVSLFPVVPTLIEHFASDPDAKVKVPLMVAAPGLAIALLAPFVGYFVDRFGRRELLLWCTFFYGVFGCAPLVLENLNAIFASRLLLGVTEAGILTGVNTLIGDYWDDKGRKNWLFLQGVLGPFVAAFVTLAAGFSAKLMWNGVFLIYLVAFIIWIAMVRYIVEPTLSDADKQLAAGETPSEGVPLNSAFPMKNALTVAAVTLFSSALYYVFIISGGLAFHEIGVTDSAKVGELTFVPSLFVMVGAAIFRLLANRGNAVQLGTFLAMMGIGLAGIGLSRTVPEMLVALVIQQTAAGMAVPTLISWAQTKFDFKHRGRGMGFWTGAFFFGQFTSPWMVHRLDLSTGTVKGAFVAMGFVALAGVVIAFVNAARTNKNR